MKATVYLDVFFLVNFAMDAVLLQLTGRVMAMPAAGRLRFFSGAAVGAVWACLNLLLAVGAGYPAWLEWVLTCPAVGSLMILVTFGRKPAPEFIRCVLTLWLIGAVAGGLCGEAERWLARPFSLAGARMWRQWTLAQIGCMAVAVFFLGSGCVHGFRSFFAVRSTVCRVRLHDRGRVKEAVALLDTGNRLTEPYGGQPVHVITAAALRGLGETVPGMIYIPFCSVGKERGLLPAIRIERIEVIREGRTVHTLRRPWLAIVKEPLSPEHQYDMLLNVRAAGDVQKMENKNLED
ncbi:MAG: sigma-E processing peptidase SpoIIGA [Clostridiales bacterium]|nr:sigma-E processing peptidase SpoIIGA [Clostridiales bacterium]